MEPTCVFSHADVTVFVYLFPCSKSAALLEYNVPNMWLLTCAAPGGGGSSSPPVQAWDCISVQRTFVEKLRGCPPLPALSQRLNQVRNTSNTLGFIEALPGTFLVV